jgi:hypothetical protein
MLTARATKRLHEKVPALGAIVVVEIRPLQFGHRWRRFRVVGYPLLNKRGIKMTHCVLIQALDNGSLHMVSGFYCKEI